MQLRITCTLLCVVVSLETTAEARRVGKNKVAPSVQDDSPQSEYEEYDAEYDYDYDNGTENNRK